MYITYEEYEACGGTADLTAFEMLCLQACARIDRLTHGRAARLSPIPDAVKMAAVTAVNELYRHRLADGEGRVSSFANDGMSVSFAQENAQERELAVCNAIVGCLYGARAQDGKTPLLYAGVG